MNAYLVTFPPVKNRAIVKKTLNHQDLPAQQTKAVVESSGEFVLTYFTSDSQGQVFLTQSYKGDVAMRSDQLGLEKLSVEKPKKLPKVIEEPTIKEEVKEAPKKYSWKE